MEKKELLELVNFFNQIEVEEIDITTDEQRTDGQLVVEVIYGFEGKAYKTKPLFYMQPNLQKNAAKSDYVSFFEEESYWLDIDINSWPEGTGGNIENTAIPDMTDDEEFKEFLLKLVNMSKTGYIQKMMRDGRSNQYGFNLENNNHWHDLINLIKAVIKNKGNEVDKKYFSRLIFEWNSGSRVSLHTNYGNRKIISDFYKNIQSIKQDMNNQDSINEYISILKLKKQIILQGAPGTGKTFTAKQIAEEMTQQQTVGQYKLDVQVFLFM